MCQVQIVSRRTIRLLFLLKPRTELVLIFLSAVAGQIAHNTMTSDYPLLFVQQFDGVEY